MCVRMALSARGSPSRARLWPRRSPTTSMSRRCRFSISL
jgi:hypothetical protein